MSHFEQRFLLREMDREAVEMRCLTITIVVDPLS
jgi:hypothetical protein